MFLSLREKTVPVVRLPDGSERKFDQPVTVMEVATSIGSGLARAAIAGKINGKLADTSDLIKNDSDLSIVTEKDAEGLEIIRHSSAHLLAHAVKELFPSVQVTIGPVIENGFYYDVDSGEQTIREEDFKKIEAKFLELAREKVDFTIKPVSKTDALSKYTAEGNEYKVEMIENLLN